MMAAVGFAADEKEAALEVTAAAKAAGSKVSRTMCTCCWSMPYLKAKRAARSDPTLLSASDELAPTHTHSRPTALEEE